MPNRWETLKEEFEKRKAFELERKKRIEQPGNEKERRAVGRRVGGLIFGLGVILGLVQFLAYTFDDVIYPKLLIFTAVLGVFALVMIVTGWMPKERRLT